MNNYKFVCVKCGKTKEEGIQVLSFTKKGNIRCEECTIKTSILSPVIIKNIVARNGLGFIERIRGSIFYIV